MERPLPRRRPRVPARRAGPGRRAAPARPAGSPDLFDAPLHSVNFVTCHDGFTLYDLVAYDHKHNEANGWSGTDGAASNRSWNCGWEGDDGLPDEVLALRHRQLRNAWCLLALSHGVPMVAMGDELGRTQGGNNNAYNQDNETSWVDWERATEFADLERFVSALLALRHRHPVLAQPTFWGDAVQFFSEPGAEGRALTWQVGDLYVLANAWGEPVDVALEEPGAVAPSSTRRWSLRRTSSTGHPVPGVDRRIAGRPAARSCSSGWARRTAGRCGLTRRATRRRRPVAGAVGPVACG